MIEQKYFPFQPEKILRTGMVVLGGIVLCTGSFLLLLYGTSSVFLGQVDQKSIDCIESKPLSLDLGITEVPIAFPLPQMKGEFSFSLDPCRPDQKGVSTCLSVSLKQRALSKRIELPGRLDLRYEEGLRFSETPTSFWLELSLKEGAVLAAVWVSSFGGEPFEAAQFFAPLEESPFRVASDFEEGSAFRMLAEARFWGHDLFRQRHGDGAIVQRLEVGRLGEVDLLDLKQEDWIGWRGGKWQKISSLEEEENGPIAHILGLKNGALLLEGWGSEGYVRLQIVPAPLSPLRVKVQDLFTAVRVRSEKQISCMLEKQCLLLRVGDWVLKGDSRWKILRKKEEKEAYLAGKFVGELFLLDRVETKGGQKVVQGQLFSASKTEMIPMEMSAHSQKKNKQVHDSIWFKKIKGKGK